MSPANPITWNPVLNQRKYAEVVVPGHHYKRITPFVTNNLDGLEIFRFTPVNFQARPTWWLAGSVIQYLGLSGDPAAMVLKMQKVQLNRRTIFVAERFNEPFFLAFEPAYWHTEMDLLIEEYRPVPGTGGGGSSTPSTAIIVKKNAIVNPSFEIWNATGSGDFTPRGTQRTTLAPGWILRTWTNQSPDFGLVRITRKEQQDDNLPFNTFLRWEQVKPTDTSGALYLTNQINEQAVRPGDTITFSCFARTSSPSGVRVQIVMEGGKHPWTLIGNLNANSVWAPFVFKHQIPNDVFSNLHGLLLQFYMPSGRTFDFDVAGLQLEVSSSPTSLELYLA